MTRGIIENKFNGIALLKQENLSSIEANTDQYPFINDLIH